MTGHRACHLDSQLSVKRNCPPRLVPHPIGRAKTIADAAAAHSGFREGGMKSNFVFANFLGS